MNLDYLKISIIQCVKKQNKKQYILIYFFSCSVTVFLFYFFYLISTCISEGGDWRYLHYADLCTTNSEMCKKNRSQKGKFYPSTPVNLPV